MNGLNDFSSHLVVNCWCILYHCFNPIGLEFKVMSGGHRFILWIFGMRTEFVVPLTMNKG